eukprot:20533-Prymnesium_polylepis.1
MPRCRALSSATHTTRRLRSCHPHPIPEPSPKTSAPTPPPSSAPQGGVAALHRARTRARLAIAARATLPQRLSHRPRRSHPPCACAPPTRRSAAAAGIAWAIRSRRQSK